MLYAVIVTIVALLLGVLLVIHWLEVKRLEGEFDKESFAHQLTKDELKVASKLADSKQLKDAATILELSRINDQASDDMKRQIEQSNAAQDEWSAKYTKLKENFDDLRSRLLGVVDAVKGKT